MSGVMPDISAIRPYGDTLDDGRIQLSFALPLEASAQAREAARQIVLKLGLEDVTSVHMQDLGEGFSFHVLYARVTVSVDASRIVIARVTTPVLSFTEVNEYISARYRRPLRVVGACTGSDAHTVGLDAIMNMKGYAGEYGLERYSGFRTWNLGAQVPNEDLIARALEVDADAILVSQVVTQKDVHVRNLTNLVELLEADGVRDRFVLVVGGPRVSHELALELGFDAGFGSGTLPPEVASYLAHACLLRGTAATWSDASGETAAQGDSSWIR